MNETPGPFVATARPGRGAAEPLRTAARGLRGWLLDHALPLWARVGLDRADGGFHDLLDHADGAPLGGPKRTFVQARQIHVFAEARTLGWDGPADRAIDHGLSALDGPCRRADWGFVHSFAASDADAGRRLYDHAFVAFALASAAAAGRPERLEAARAVVGELDRHWWRPEGDHRESDGAETADRGQNPHMHLLEALLEIAEVSGRAADIARAEAAAASLTGWLFDRERGVVPEHFDARRRPVAHDGVVLVEPGHQFEWAWLLSRLGHVGGTDRGDTAEALWDFGRRHGVDAARGVAIDAIDRDGRVVAATARLWPQAERVKAAVAMLERGVRGAEAEAVAAAAGLARYLETKTAGLYHDTMTADGRFVVAPVRASSLYHLVGAIGELDRVAGR